MVPSSLSVSNNFAGEIHDSVLVHLQPILAYYLSLPICNGWLGGLGLCVYHWRLFVQISRSADWLISKALHQQQLRLNDLVHVALDQSPC